MLVNVRAAFNFMMLLITLRISEYISTVSGIDFSNLQVQPVREGDFAFLKCREDLNFSQKIIGTRWKLRNRLIVELLGIKEYIVPDLRERLQIHHGSTLKLIGIRSTDRGLYTCFVQTQTDQWIEVNQVFLDVQEPPTIVQSSLMRTVVELGSNVTLFCQWTANPRAEVTWLRGLPIPLETDCTDKCVHSNSHSLPAVVVKGRKPRSSQLVFHNFRDEDVDEYTCRVKNSLGTAIRTMAILIRGRAAIVKKPENQTVLEGLPHLLFHCRIITEKEVTHYSWLKNGKDLSLYPGMQHRYKVFSNGTLLLLNLNRSDTGVYTCSAHGKRMKNGADLINSDHTPTSRSSMHTIHGKNDVFTVERFNYNHESDLQGTVSAKLDVHFSPEAHMLKKQPIYLGFNGPGRLPCTVTANPTVEFIEWGKVRDLTSHSSTRSPISVLAPSKSNPQVWPVLVSIDQLASRRESKTSQMTITYWYEWETVHWTDSGVYRCRGRNQQQWGPWSNELQVIVKQFPWFHTRPPPVLNLPVNSIILLHCAAEGDPKPRIDWVSFRNGIITEELPKTAAISNRNYLRLLVTESMRNGLTLYCIATNSLGRVMTSVNVTAHLSHSTTNKITGPTLVELSDFLVQPKAFGAWLSWKSKVSPVPMPLNTEVERDHTTRPRLQIPSCHAVVYHRIVRRQEKWISLHVQPDDTSRIWLGGLIPDEFYAFRLAIWCGPEQHSAISPVLYAQTETWPENLDHSSQFHGGVITDQDNSPIILSKDPSPERPIGLKILFPPARPQSLSSPNIQFLQSSQISGPTLQWIHQEPNHPPHSISTPVLYYRVEYKLVALSNTSNTNQRCTVPVFQAAINDWASLAPVRAPHNKFQFRVPTELPTGSITALSSLITSPGACFTKLYFRVRSYSLNSGSEPSRSLYISWPLLDQIIPVLYVTVLWEQRALQNIVDSFAFDEPILENAHSISFENGTSSSEYKFNIPEEVWFGLSYTLLSLLLLFFVLLIGFVTRRRMRRKNKNRYLQSHDPPDVSHQDTGNYMFTNQLRSTQLCDSSELTVSPERSLNLYTTLSSDFKRFNNKWTPFCHSPHSTPSWNNSHRTSEEHTCSPLLATSRSTHRACIHKEQYCMIPFGKVSQRGSEQHEHTVWTDTHAAQSSSSETAQHPLELTVSDSVDVKTKAGGQSLGCSIHNSPLQLDLLPRNKLQLDSTSQLVSDMKLAIQPVYQSVVEQPSCYSTLSWIGTLQPTLPTTVQPGDLNPPSPNSQTAYVVLPVNSIDPEVKSDTLQIAYVPLGSECVPLYTTVDPNQQSPMSNVSLANSILCTPQEHLISTNHQARQHVCYADQQKPHHS